MLPALRQQLPNGVVVNRSCMGLTFAVVLACCGVPAAQECPPGPQQTMTEALNGQIIEFSVTRITVTVQFSEVSSTRIAGVARLTSGGTTPGCVTIRWVDQGIMVVLHLSSANPEARFEMVPTAIETVTLSKFKSMYRW